jgi:hypothetical protein
VPKQAVPIQAVPEQALPKQDNLLPKQAVEGLPKQADTIDIRTIDTKQKKKSLSGSQTEPDAFVAFYNFYPRHDARKEALAAWNKLKPESGMVLTLMTALDKQKKLWMQEGRLKKYIPLPATWLNGARWTDEIPGEEQQTQESIETINDENGEMLYQLKNGEYYQGTEKGLKKYQESKNGTREN